MDQVYEPVVRPHLPSHKQTRINIWRDEVASLIPQPRPPLSSAQSTTTTTSSSSHSTGTYPFAAAEDDAPPKKSIWRRITKRIRGKADEPVSGHVMNGLHTEMYREELGAWRTTAEPEAAVGDEVSEQGGRGLKDKQERLERAARLLTEGAEKS